MSRRQDLVDAMLVRFRTIKLANGYETNLGLNVHEWRTDALVEGEGDVLNIRDTAEIVEETIGEHTHRLTIEIDLMSIRALPVSQYRDMLADLIAAIGVDETWGGLGERTELGAEDLLVEQASRKVLGATVRFLVVYSTPRYVSA